MRGIAVVQAAVQAIVLCTLLACGPERSDSGEAAAPPATASSEAPARATDPGDDAGGPASAELVADRDDAPRRAARAPGERPLPGFSGPTLSGTRLSVSSLIGRRLVLFFFNPEVDAADVVADAVVEVARQQQDHNFRVVGVGIGSDRSTVRRFATEHGIEFPVIDDSSGQITNLLRLPGPVLILGADAEGYVSFVLPGFDTSAEDAEQAIAGRLRESLRIPSVPHGGRLVEHPEAPTFETVDLAGEPFDLADLAGRPKIVMFFLHTCPHCHKALEFFEKNLADIPEAKRPALVAISVQNRPSAVRMALADEGLDFFTPLVDPGGEIASAYGLSSGVPDISLVDAEGEIVYRMQGWREDRDPALMRMYLHRIAGEPVPMLLSRQGYTGNDACAVCHEQEAATWEITPHARAYDTLVPHGQERLAECVSCHVVGFEEPGGYSFTHPATYLEGVGCESCHGRGGPHLSPGFLAEQAAKYPLRAPAPDDDDAAGQAAPTYAGACLGCHDTKHSLGFEYETFLPGISHEAIAALSPAERAERFEEGLSHRELLPSTADYVGSEACQSCHAAEYATWAESAHAHAIDTLRSRDRAGDADCLRCHTTAFEEPGGFPAGGDVAAHPDLARVGCESCHGPGGEHVGEDARRFGTIVSLGDKCDSCVILQICGSCHDAENDPDFEFSVQEHIDRQRHGTTEAGTGKPLGKSAWLRAAPSLEARVAHAMRLLEASTPAPPPAASPDPTRTPAHGG